MKLIISCWSYEHSNMLFYDLFHFCSICRAKEAKYFRYKGWNRWGRSFGTLFVFLILFESFLLSSALMGFWYMCLSICRFGKWIWRQEVCSQTLRVYFLLSCGNTNQIWTIIKANLRNLYPVTWTLLPGICCWNQAWLMLWRYDWFLIDFSLLCETMMAMYLNSNL